MTFLSAAFLGGLAALAVPIVLHLIHRQRYPERPFTALRFFDATIKQNVIQRRLIDKLLLLLRLAALALLMAGLARPFWRSGFGERRMSLVMVLDNSPSMGRRSNDGSLFERACEAARAAAAELGASDRAALILTAPVSVMEYTPDRTALSRELATRSGQPTGLIVNGRPELSVPGLTTDSEALRAALTRAPEGVEVALVGCEAHTEEVLRYGPADLLRQLERARLSHCRGDLATALRRAAGRLRSSNDGDQAVMVFSDLQQSEWRAAGAALSGLRVRVFPILPGEKQGLNLAVTACEAPAGEAVLGERVLAEATLRNCGTQPSPEARLTVAVGARTRPTEVRVPPIPAGAELRVPFPVSVMTRERSLLCSVQCTCPGDPFPYDDVYHFQIGVRPPVMALCVNGTAASSAAERETFFVMSALVAQTATGGQAVDARECDIADLGKERLFQYGVLVLAGVEQLDRDSRDTISQFVQDGRSVLVFPARDARPEEYNSWAFLPATVEDVESGEFVFVRELSSKASLVSGLAARLGTGLHTLTTDSWLRLIPERDAQVIARFDNGAPALVEGKFGRGRVVVVATGGHTTGSQWPLRPAFPVLVRALVQNLGAPDSPMPLRPGCEVGEDVCRSIPAELAGGTPALFRAAKKEGQTAYESLPWLRRGAALVLPAAAVPGQHLLAVRPGLAAGFLSEPGIGSSVQSVSVNPSSAESYLSSASVNEIPSLLVNAEVEMASPDEEPTATLAALRKGSDLWRVLLAFALLALVAESLIGWRWPSQSAG